jgi:hypothetical protein
MTLYSQKMDMSDHERAMSFPCAGFGAKVVEECSEPASPDFRVGRRVSLLPRQEPVIAYTFEPVKPLAELRPSDVPRGMDSDDLATDLAPEGDG